MYRNNKIFNTFLFSTCLIILSVFGETIGFPKDTALMLIEVRETNEREEEENVRYVEEINERIKHSGSGGNDFEEKEVVIIQPNIQNLTHTPTPTFIQIYIQEHFSLKEYTNKLNNSLFFPKLYLLFHCPKTFLV